MDTIVMNEDPHAIYYGSWKNLPTHQLLRLRYEEGVRLRSTRPRPAYPTWNYMLVTVINRILAERMNDGAA